MRELRVQVQGRPFRVLYAFDPRRAAILLLGGDKTGDNRWYEKNVPIADDHYDEHLIELEKRSKEVDMAKKFSTILEKMPADRRKKIEREARELREELSLAKLRGAMELTQQALATTLEIDQSQVARMEKRTDMLISTLSSYVQALGGTLEVRASFPDGKVYNIAQFSGLAKIGSVE